MALLSDPLGTVSGVGPFDFTGLLGELLGRRGRNVLGLVLMACLWGWAKHWPLAFPAVQWVLDAETAIRTRATLKLLPYGSAG